MADEREHQDNRARKVAGREKRRRFVQGTRNYLHDVTNSIARRGKRAPKGGGR
jgi:hypothetical protein